MERLTSYENGCGREMICKYESCNTEKEYCPHMNEDICSCLQDVLNKLSEYEELEDKGKLPRLPVAVGDVDIEEVGKTIFTDEKIAENILKEKEEKR